ncbi:hypothetical protein SVEN_2172 [Streptomyces venezuelae ATCC 10712]|uniref:Uncharacterized protein n=1 Tax=Streptomyces venezuelae (strain ATCC 10712 / CBS 650.69 / DSM 40230 / JCM 4526 / NBRC 13096 / PD 04745) TaxID=953739 RepID=F2R0U1_STRVP|nr:hypothetical protein SVEN_2172 [Streptomyces venezuelae ATCC 10712]
MLCRKGCRGRWAVAAQLGEEIARGDVKRASYAKEVAEFGIVLAALDALDRGPIDLGPVRELFLREVCIEPGITDPPP